MRDSRSWPRCSQSATGSPTERSSPLAAASPLQAQGVRAQHFQARHRRRESPRRAVSLFFRNRPHGAGIELVDETVNPVAICKKWALAQLFDRLEHRLIEVLERPHLHAWPVPALAPDRIDELRLPAFEESAAGVAEDEHFARAKDGLRKRQRAQNVRRSPRAGVANHVRVATTEAEERDRTDARTHACEDGYLEPGLGRLLRRRLVSPGSCLGEKTVDPVRGSMTR